MNTHTFSALPHTGDLIISYLPWLFVIAAVIIAIVVGFLMYSKHKAVKANYIPRHAAAEAQPQEGSTPEAAAPAQSAPADAAPAAPAEPAPVPEEPASTPAPKPAAPSPAHDAPHKPARDSQDKPQL